MLDDPAEVIRRTYLERSCGVLERGSRECLHVHEGELYLAPGHRLAGRLAQALEAAHGPPSASLELQSIAVEIAAELASDSADVSFNADWTELRPELVGPLPTVSVVLDLAVRDSDEGSLLMRLGGAGARYRSTGDSPALGQLPSLDPDMAQGLAMVESPTSVADLMRGRSGGVDILRGLAKLRAVGLIEKQGRDRRESAHLEVTSREMELFSDRIRESLRQDPLDLTPEEHRGWIAEQIRNLSSNHYELLGVQRSSGDGEIAVAFQKLARLAHPLHAAALSIPGQEKLLELLFTRATNAYLTLSDPHRRCSYNVLTGIEENKPVPREQRRQELRDLAATNYRLALRYLSDTQCDYGPAISLLQEATRLDPKPEYFALRGQAEAKNPLWLFEAITSYREAVRLDPKNAGFRVALGTLLEKTGDSKAALAEYEEALVSMPDHPEAKSGVGRLGGLGVLRKSIFRLWG